MVGILAGGWWMDNREAVDENGGFWMTGGAVGSEQLGRETTSIGGPAAASGCS